MADTGKDGGAVLGTESSHLKAPEEYLCLRRIDGGFSCFRFGNNCGRREKLFHKTTWKNAPEGRIRKSDVSIAKNYLDETEMGSLNEIVTMYLDYAERQARRGNIMYMRDWVARLDAFLQFNEEDVLYHKGKVTAAIAKAFAESEFEKYRVIQDRLYQSDFDRLVASTVEKD